MCNGKMKMLNCCLKDDDSTGWGNTLLALGAAWTYCLPLAQHGHCYLQWKMIAWRDTAGDSLHLAIWCIGIGIALVAFSPLAHGANMNMHDIVESVFDVPGWAWRMEKGLILAWKRRNVPAQEKG
jgi:hypothetical protein